MPSSPPRAGQSLTTGPNAPAVRSHGLANRTVDVGARRGCRVEARNWVRLWRVHVRSLAAAGGACQAGEVGAPDGERSAEHVEPGGAPAPAWGFAQGSRMGRLADHPDGWRRAGPRDYRAGAPMARRARQRKLTGRQAWR